MKKIAGIHILMVALAMSTARAQADDTVAQGKIAFGQICAHCHSAAPGMVGTAVLARRLDKEKSVLENRTDLTPIYIEAIVRNGLGIMPGFRRTELSNDEVRSIAAYLTRNNPQH